MVDYRFGQVRRPVGHELEWFQQNPTIAGRADFETGTVVLNPFATLTEREFESVRLNELSRLVMRKYGIVPKFNITKEQQESLKEYGNAQQIRETLAGRIFSGDPSAGYVTSEQDKFVNDLRKKMIHFSETGRLVY